MRKVISTLTETQQDTKAFIPYRESKLTSLLKEGIGGSGYTLMLSTLSPSNRFVEENVSTLQYATKAGHIANVPVRNEDARSSLIFELKVALGER